MGQAGSVVMKVLLALLLVLLLLLQYRLWMAEDGVRQMWQLRATVAEQRAENAELRRRNEALEAEVEDLRQGQDALEERARSDLGMIREGEVFFQIVRDPSESGDEQD